MNWKKELEKIKVGDLVYDFVQKCYFKVYKIHTNQLISGWHESTRQRAESIFQDGVASQIKNCQKV